MGGSRFIPILIAGLVGLIVGWWAAPDFDEASETMAGQIEELKAPIGQIQTNVDALSTRLSEPAADTGDGAATEAVNALGSRFDQLTNELQSRTDAITQAVQEQAGQAAGGAAAKLDEIATQLKSLEERIASGTPQPSTSEVAATTATPGGDPAALAEQIGASGAILLPGQAAIFGGYTVRLTAISAETGSATLVVSDGESQEVAAGEAINVRETCEVSVAGIAADAAYLAAQGCEQAAASAPQAAIAPEAPVDGQQAAQATTETAPTAGEQAASAGSEQPAPETDAQAAAPAEQQQATEASATPAAQPEGQQPAEPAGNPQSGGGNSASVPTGGTAVFGDTRVFVSAIGETDASLFVAGKGRQTVETGAALDAGNGCMVTVAGIENGQVQLTAEGCASGDSSEGQAAAASDGAQPSAAADAETAAPTAEEQPTDAADNGAEAAPAADPGEATTPAADEPAAPTGGDTAGSASGLTTGQTATFGEKKIFVSAITDTGATLQVIGGARQQVETGGAIDLGDGCTVTLDKVEDRSAFLSGTGC
ncbi:MAG TPA: hypothetical protein ENH89_08665 [Aurantimonas coralicida]|uniref:Uncharacterized protein n=1 Tax=Aurantimonas coralicida TaxID=182270 RepID=A0A9C9NEG0_9HYPH|nr:hypothetical protein [Aurantimonas coralicida]